ncbi:MAG TPA: helix-turn-helix domain-containing protein [Sphingomicrobium sp.]|nr:helix-turn-helix domain-containing protein [Sphingomicrobium sp.]
MLAPAPRYDEPLPAGHPCVDCQVRSCAVCGVLNHRELAHFKGLGWHVILTTGQPLFHEGDPATRVFTLTTGTLKLYKLLADGRRQVTGFMHPGDFLGVSVADEHAFTAEALEPARLCWFPRNRFDDFVDEHPEMERELYRLAAHELAAAQQQMVLLGRKTAAERAASFLIMLADKAKNLSPGARFVELPMSRSDIADYLGLTKETVSRVFSQLRRDRLIRLETLDRVEILDRKRLTRIADCAG